MFGVIQFMENGRLQVLAVPMSWIRKGLLMWPKNLSNDKVDKMRTEGTIFNGATKTIPVIVTKKFRSFQAAEASVEELSRRDVSDFEGKKNQLKSIPKSKPTKKQNDYNQLCTAIVHKQEHVSSFKTLPAAPQFTCPPPIGSVLLQQQLPPPAGFTTTSAPPMSPVSIVRTSLPTKEPPIVVSVHPTGCSPAPPSLSPVSAVQSSLPLREPHMFVSVPSASTLSQQRSNLPLVTQTPQRNVIMRRTTTARSGSAESVEGQNNNMITTDTYFGSVTSKINQQIVSEEQMESDDWIDQEIHVKPLEITSTLSGTNMEQTETIPDLDALIRKNIIDVVNEVVPAAIQKYMDEHIDKIMDRVVSAAVDRSFAANFARLTAMTGVLNKSTQEETELKEVTQIDTEEELFKWNAELSKGAERAVYMKYFSKIVVPNAYMEKGDNVFYLISDMLFTREFWNRFTWTGVNRGEKSERGFREFGHVTQLLLSIVQIGDPSYTRQKLEKFCKTRLFRHSKSRSANKMLRKSSCRTKRGSKKKRMPKDTTDDESGPSNTVLDDTDADGRENTDEFENVSLLKQADESDDAEYEDEGEHNTNASSDSM